MSTTKPLLNKKKKTATVSKTMSIRDLANIKVIGIPVGVHDKYNICLELRPGGNEIYATRKGGVSGEFISVDELIKLSGVSKFATDLKKAEKKSDQMKIVTNARFHNKSSLVEEPAAPAKIMEAYKLMENLSRSKEVVSRMPTRSAQDGLVKKLFETEMDKAEIVLSNLVTGYVAGITNLKITELMHAAQVSRWFYGKFIMTFPALEVTQDLWKVFSGKADPEKSAHLLIGEIMDWPAEAVKRWGTHMESFQTLLKDKTLRELLTAKMVEDETNPEWGRFCKIKIIAVPFASSREQLLHTASKRVVYAPNRALRHDLIQAGLNEIVLRELYYVPMQLEDIGVYWKSVAPDASRLRPPGPGVPDYLAQIVAELLADVTRKLKEPGAADNESFVGLKWKEKLPITALLQDPANIKTLYPDVPVAHRLADHFYTPEIRTRGTEAEIDTSRALVEAYHTFTATAPLKEPPKTVKKREQFASTPLTTRVKEIDKEYFRTLARRTRKEILDYLRSFRDTGFMEIAALRIATLYDDVEDEASDDNSDGTDDY